MRRPRRKSLLRLAARAALFALIGAAATVLVAWDATLAMSTRRPLRSTYEAVSPGKPWPCRVPSDWPSECNTRIDWGGFATTVLVAEIRPVLLGPSSDHTRAFRREVRWSGWPAPALRMDGYVTWHGRDPAERHSSRRERATGLRVPALRQEEYPWALSRSLPLRPVPAGFSLDTAIYGSLAFAIWSVPGFLRRHSRRRHGRCVGCGYDLSATTGTCPECGRAISRRRADEKLGGSAPESVPIR